MKTPFLYQARALLVAALLPLGASAASESPSLLLQKGIYAEEIERNLDSAIRIYQQITAEAAANRSVVAQAQYRLAVCQQKKGDKAQAVSLLNDLLRQFPAEAALGQKARTFLAELGQSPTDAVTIRKLPLQIGVAKAVSPDGRYLAYYTPSKAYDIVICETATGKTWLARKGSEESYPWYDVSFSPDGRQFAYDIIGATVYLTNVDGTETKPLYKADDKGGVGVVGWSADGQQLIVGTWDTKTDAICALDIKTGAKRQLKELAGADKIEKERGGWRLSACGRYLAYRNGAIHRIISIIDLESGTDTTVVPREVVELIGWSPNDEKLLFSSRRTGTTALWGIAVKNGQAGGEPELIRPNLGEAEVKGVTREGSIFYTEAVGSSANVYVARVDFQTGEITNPRRVLDRSPGDQIRPIWARSGERLMLTVWQGPQRGFVTVSMQSEEPREFFTAESFRGLLQKSTWSEEGNFMLVQALATRMAGGKAGIHRYDLASGKIETLVADQPRNTWNVHPQLSRDGASFYYLRREFSKAADNTDAWKASFVRRDLRTGKEEIVFGPDEKINVWSPLALSPDGSRLAFVASDEYKNENSEVAIKVIGLDGAAKKELVRLAPRMTVTSIAWTPDGKRLVYSKAPPGTTYYYPSQNEVSAITVDSGQSVRLNFPQPGVNDIAVHPDGRQIAYRAGRLRLDRNLWVLEGVFSKTVAGPARTTGN